MNNKETLQSYNTNLSTNNDTLGSILETINNLPEAGGGSNEPAANEITSIQELNNIMVESMTKLMDYYQSCIDNTFDAGTNEPVTLYTPAEGFNYYVIRYRGNMFQAVWFNCMFIKERTAPVVQELNPQSIGSLNTSVSFRGYAYIPDTIVTASFNDSTVNAYLSPTFSTVEEVIDALKSSETTYTTAFNSNFTIQYHSGDNYDSYNSTPYTNMYFMNYQYNLVTKKKISSDETIMVIPTE